MVESWKLETLESGRCDLCHPCACLGTMRQREREQERQGERERAQEKGRARTKEEHRHVCGAIL